MTRRKNPGVREPWPPATATTEEEALRFAQGQASGGTECSGMHKRAGRRNDYSMIEQAAEANEAFVDRLEMIAGGH